MRISGAVIMTFIGVQIELGAYTLGMRKAAIFLLTITMGCWLASCTAMRSYSGYVVTEKKSSLVADEPTCLYAQCEIVTYTLLHNGHKIIAHCQAFDPMNRCGTLMVGESYKFKRDTLVG